MKRNITLKHIYGLFILSLFGTSCATTVVPKVEFVPTVQSDLFPQGMSRAEYYEGMGVAYSAEGDNEKAVDYFRLALLHSPNRITAHLALSDEYRKIGSDHLADFELREVLKLESKNKIALYKLGELYLSKQIFSKAREAYSDLLKVDDKYEEARWAIYFIYKLEKNDVAAEKTLNSLSIQEKNTARWFYEKAAMAKNFKRLKDYTSYLEKAYSLEPRNRQYTLDMNEYAIKNNQYDRSIDILRNYAATHSFDLEISRLMAFSAIRAENYELALGELDKQKSWVIDSSALEMKKAHIYFIMGDLQKAEDKYIQTLARSPRREEGYFYLAQIYLYQNRLDEAKLVLQNLTSASDYFAEAQSRLAFFEKQNGQSDLAINRLRTAHNLRPDQLAIYKAYSEFLIDSERYVETIALLEKGIAFFPKDEDLRVKAAFVHYRLKNKPAFKRQLAKALQINPNNADVYSALTELWYLRNKNPKETEYFANKALQFKTKNKNIKPLLAWALMEQNRSTEAVALFENFYDENPQQPYYAEALARVYKGADVTIKAQEMKRLAAQLQNSDSLKSGLILDSKIKSIDSNQSNSSPVRLPASLENQ